MPARRTAVVAVVPVLSLVLACLVGCGTKEAPRERGPVPPRDVVEKAAEPETPAPPAPTMPTTPKAVARVTPPAPEPEPEPVEPPAPVAKEELGEPREPEWQSLFDGESLEGWEQKGGKAEYSARDGAIVGTTVIKTPNSFLCTKKHYSDFVLELEFKVTPGLNSGVQIRSNSLKEYKKGRVHGYQVEIDPSKRAWTAGIYDEGRRGWLNNLKENEAARKAFRQNEWNKFRIEAVGDSIKTWLNGVPAADLTDSKTPSGFIGLQVHGCKTAGLEVMWRDIRIKDLAEGGE